MRRFALAVLLFTGCATSSVQDRLHVTLQPDEAKAVLAILDARAAQQSIREADWQRLFSSEGYVRLKKRELSMHREFDDPTFRTFVMSPELLAKREVLASTLNQWLRADLTHAASLSMAYLPSEATITATVYPVIKPKTNSFVFEGNDIFEYLDEQPVARFENILAHEMHHIGYGTACPPKGVEVELERLPPNLKALREWLSAFGEGAATLAAAGGPDAPPQVTAPPDVRAAWDQGIANYDAELHRVEQFYLDILDGRITGDDIPKRGFEFFGLLGPWYTVGWKMDVVIEKTFGRAALLDAFCDQRRLLGTYNRAAAEWERRTGEKLPRWDQRLVDAFPTTPSS
jgi:hypothetical protein